MHPSSCLSSILRIKAMLKKVAEINEMYIDVYYKEDIHAEQCRTKQKTNVILF